MPDLPFRRPTRLRTARNLLMVAWHAFVNSAALAAVLVALGAIALSYLRVELQYVAGAFLIVFAARLSQKRIAPTVTMVEAPGRKTPARDLLDPKDPINLSP